MYLHVEKDCRKFIYHILFVVCYRTDTKMCILCTVHRSVTGFNIGLKLVQVYLFCRVNLSLGYMFQIFLKFPK